MEKVYSIISWVATIIYWAYVFVKIENYTKYVINSNGTFWTDYKIRRIAILTVLMCFFIFVLIAISIRFTLISVGLETII